MMPDIMGKDHSLIRNRLPEVVCKKVLLKISQKSQENTCQENTCARVSFLIKFQVSVFCFKIETLAQVFSCEF